MKNKLLIGILLIFAIGIFFITNVKNESGNVNTKDKKINQINKNFDAKIRIVDAEFLKRWKGTTVETPQFSRNINEVRGGDNIYFPVLFSHFSLDENGYGWYQRRLN